MFPFYKRIIIVVLTGLVLAGSKVVFADSPEGLFRASSDQYETALVARVLAVDTIKLENGEKVKLIGIRAPEVPKRREEALRDKYGFIVEETNPVVSIEEQAFDFVRLLLEGKAVRLEFDAQKRGDGLKTLAYVFLEDDQTFVNAEILRQGFAFLQIRPPNTKYAERLREAYKESRREKKGLQGE